MCGEGSEEQAESAHVVDRAVGGVGVLVGGVLVTMVEDVAEGGNRPTLPSRRSGVGRLRFGRRQDHERLIPARRQKGVDSIPV
jgi:hypothetical protein